MDGAVSFNQLVAVVFGPRRLGPIRAWESRRTDLPLVLAGDFNAGYAHPVFSELARKLHRRRCGGGAFPPPRWPADGSITAFTAIDRILARGFDGTELATGPHARYRHYGILATLMGAGPRWSRRLAQGIPASAGHGGGCCLTGLGGLHALRL